MQLAAPESFSQGGLRIYDQASSSLEGCAMLSLRQRSQCLLSLGAGIVAGLGLALLAWRSSGDEPARVILVTGLPFLLAALTGLAKTTTA